MLTELALRKGNWVTNRLFPMKVTRSGHLTKAPDLQLWHHGFYICDEPRLSGDHYLVQYYDGYKRTPQLTLANEVDAMDLPTPKFIYADRYFTYENFHVVEVSMVDAGLKLILRYYDVFDAQGKFVRRGEARLDNSLVVPVWNSNKVLEIDVNSLEVSAFQLSGIK